MKIKLSFNSYSITLYQPCPYNTPMVARRWRNLPRRQAKKLRRLQAILTPASNSSIYFPISLSLSNSDADEYEPHQSNPTNCFDSNDSNSSPKSPSNQTLSDESLTADLALEIKRLNSKVSQREGAFNKSRELLFAEISHFAGFKSEDFKSKWLRMNDDEKWVLVRGFVAEWSADFHPLSARSVKELVEEYVGIIDQFSESDSGNMHPDFRKLFGFHQGRFGEEDDLRKMVHEFGEEEDD